MPSHVSTEYASIAAARYAGLSLCSHTSSIHTKARNRMTAGQAPMASGYRSPIASLRPGRRRVKRASAQANSVSSGLTSAHKSPSSAEI